MDYHVATEAFIRDGYMPLEANHLKTGDHHGS